MRPWWWWMGRPPKDLGPAEQRGILTELVKEYEADMSADTYLLAAAIQALWDLQVSGEEMKERGIRTRGLTSRSRP